MKYIFSIIVVCCLLADIKAQQTLAEDLISLEKNMKLATTKDWQLFEKYDSLGLLKKWIYKSSESKLCGKVKAYTHQAGAHFGIFLLKNVQLLDSYCASYWLFFSFKTNMYFVIQSFRNAYISISVYNLQLRYLGQLYLVHYQADCGFFTVSDTSIGSAGINRYSKTSQTTVESNCDKKTLEDFLLCVEQNFLNLKNMPAIDTSEHKNFSQFPN